MNKNILKFVVPIVIVLAAVIVYSLSSILNDTTENTNSGYSGVSVESDTYIDNDYVSTESDNSLTEKLTTESDDTLYVDYEEPSVLENYFDYVGNVSTPMKIPENVTNTLYEDYFVEELELILSVVSKHYPIDNLLEIKPAETTDYMLRKCMPYSLVLQDTKLLCYIYDNIVYIKEISEISN